MGKKGKTGQEKGKETKLKGKEGFEAYYTSIFGERWNELKEAFTKENVYARIFTEGKEDYFLDPASLFCAFQLPLENADRILDMCAAPGGKTLVLAHRMKENAFLQSNERSAPRKARLLQVCDSSLDEQIRERIKITNYDGALMCKKETEQFDAILLDAPCSSERHVFLDPKYLDQWSENRIKTLSMEQWALVSSAWRLLTPGGYLLYSTCALTPKENDEVISRLLKKFDDAFLVYGNSGIPKNNDAAANTSVPGLKAETASVFAEFKEIPVFEKTAYGFHILPDRSNGAGPIWFSLIGKKPEE